MTSRMWLIALLVIAGVGGASFGISRWLNAQAIEAGQIVIDERKKAHSAPTPAADPEVEKRKAMLESMLKVVEQKLVERPADSMLLVSAGNMSYDLGLFEPAERYYKAFLENVEPNNLRVRIDYAYVVFQNGRKDEALAIMKKVIKQHPKDQTALYNLGVMYIQAKNPDEALKAMKACRDAAPETELGKRAAMAVIQLETTT